MRDRITWKLAIVLASAALGMLAEWRAPGISQYGRDWLIRVRGPLPAPDDIAIVAIDEASIAQYGRFPWPRSIMARALNVLAAAQPKVIALDVLYSEPTSDTEDTALAEAIQHAGNVTAAAQLVESPNGASAWLAPLPSIAHAAAAVGHVNVSTEADGVARQMLIRMSDDSGKALRALAVETLRVGDGVADHSLVNRPHDVQLGSRMIPVETPGGTLRIDQEDRHTPSRETIQASRMTIDYIGPAGAFAPHTYSLKDVADGKAPPRLFRGKYVLVGATAASLGDRLSSPFVHGVETRGNQHGSPMPGVEVLANELNTILRSRFYSDTPDGMAFLLAALVAALTLAALSAAQGGSEGIRQMGALAGVLGAIFVGGYVLFSRFLIFPPLTSLIISFAAAGVLGLLRRSLVTSAGLDASIEDISRSEHLPAFASGPEGALERIAEITGSKGAALFGLGEKSRYLLTACTGVPVANRSPHISSDVTAPALFLPRQNGAPYQETTLPLRDSGSAGILVLAYEPGERPGGDTLRLAAIMAAGASQAAKEEAASGWWPRGVEWKAKALGRLNRQVLEKARFFDSALRSVEDGLLVAGVDGRITFANRRAAAILGIPEHSLLGRDLLERLGEEPAAGSGIEMLKRLLLDRAKVERELTFRDSRTRRYVLRMAAVSEDEQQRGAVLGIVASLSEITRQYELQQTKNDIIALVSHEMRTPLTAIQGMSELLAQFEVEPEQRREMSLAINEEAKRLTRMITGYLDITRLEAGKTALRSLPVRIETILERLMLLLQPLADQKKIHLTRSLDRNLPALLADADLLSRAVENLISNAIKYSPPETEIRVTARAEGPQAGGHGLVIEVADQGYGIPESDLTRIFEKFYRVPRVQDADVPGTGLGLALVREIAELHGGTVRVTSTVGGGSTFSIHIPQLESGE